MSSIKEKLKAVSTAIAAIEKQFGKGAIMPLAGGEVAEIGVVPTGSVGLDLALGVGGLPRGRVVEIYGPESSGKTTLTLQAIAQAQKAGGICAFIDAEHALDITYARKLGVRVEELLVSQPDCGEQALEIADKLVGTGAVDLIIVDSVAALVPRAEIEGEMGDAHMGLQARLMSQALRKLTAATSRNNTTVIFIKQLCEPGQQLHRGGAARERRTSTVSGPIVTALSSRATTARRIPWRSSAVANLRSSRRSWRARRVASAS
jgi:recombination protein RecA